jgi:CRP-like cAMP-binding protein
MSPSHAGPKAVLTVGSGDLLAWSAFLGNQRMTTTAIASTDVQVIGFDSDQARQLCDKNHEIGYRFLESVAEALSRRLVATRLQLLDLFE